MEQVNYAAKAKLQITKFDTVYGSHFSVIEIPENMPTELAELGGNKVLILEREEADEILKLHYAHCQLQMMFALLWKE